MKYTVYVGGVEVNDYYLTLDKAHELATEYKEKDYDDVLILEAPNAEED